MSNQQQTAKAKNFYQDLLRLVPIVAERSAEIGIETLRNDMEVRIFDVGADINGVVLKNGRGYSPAYAKFRQDLQRQTARIDLQLYGDLKHSIKPIKSTQGQQLIFSQEAQTDKARGLEKRWQQKIFLPSPQEADKVFDLIEEVFSKSINELNTKYSGAV
jgi:hypothetical protein